MAPGVPSESRRESQMKSNAQMHSSSRPSVAAMAAPVAETPVAEVPVAEVPVAVAPIVEAPVDKVQGAEAPVAPPPHLLPWRQEEWVMANRGPSRWRLVKKNHSEEQAS